MTEKRKNGAHASAGDLSKEAHRRAPMVQDATPEKSVRAQPATPGNKAPPVPKNFRQLLQSTSARRLCVAIQFVLLYILLDRTSVFFQMWAGISAWYPPAG